MKKLNQGELLVILEHWRMSLHEDWPSFQLDWTREHQRAYTQIAAILKNQPTITKEDTRNKSLGKLAEDLKISFSAAKIISDHAQPEITEKDIECWASEAMSRVGENAEYMWVGGYRYIEDAMKEMLTEIGVSITVDPHGKSGK